MTRPAASSTPAGPTDPGRAVLGGGLSLRGEVSGEGDFHIYGRFEGEIDVTGRVIVAEAAQVDANINAAAIVIAGKVRGNLSATTHLDILPSGVLTGTLKAGSFRPQRAPPSRERSGWSGPSPRGWATREPVTRRTTAGEPDRAAPRAPADSVGRLGGGGRRRARGRMGRLGALEDPLRGPRLDRIDPGPGLVAQSQAPGASAETRQRAEKALQDTITEYPRLSSVGQAAYLLGSLRFANGQYASARSAFELARDKAGSPTLAALAALDVGYCWEGEKNLRGGRKGLSGGY